MREIPSDYINPPLPPRPPPSPLSHQPKSNLPMLYYGLVVVGTAAIVLAIYNLIIVKWCTRRQSQRPPRRPNGRLIEATASQSSGNLERNLLSSFKYKQETNITGGQDQGNNDYECPVCLSIFEEGEEVRQLPRCKHSFHAPCIDMWLYSHFDCPLCRAPVDVPRWQRDTVMDSQENSRVNLLDSGNSTTT